MQKFNTKAAIELLPKEPMLGIKLLNFKLQCDDEIYRPILGIDFGFIFFTITLCKMYEV